MSYEELRSKINSLREQAKEECKKYFNDGAKSLFDKYPILESFSWTQYTPYFNDGDPCYFSVISDDPTINDIDGNEISYGKKHKELQSLQDEIATFISAFANEDLEALFGDHARVIVYKDKIEVEEYSHD